MANIKRTVYHGIHKDVNERMMLTSQIGTTMPSTRVRVVRCLYLRQQEIARNRSTLSATTQKNEATANIIELKSYNGVVCCLVK